VSNLPAHENDLVLGHGNSDNRSDVVLGGFDAIHSRYRNIDPLMRIVALKEAYKHGPKGLQLLHYALQDPELDVRLAAYRLARLMHPQKQPPCNYRNLFKTLDSWNWDVSNPDVIILKPTSRQSDSHNGLAWSTQKINEILAIKGDPALQKIKAIYIGDAMRSEDSYSWGQRSDKLGLTEDKFYKKSHLDMANFAPILEAFPELEVLHVCGRMESYLYSLKPSDLCHSRLKSLIIETADQSSDILSALQAAQLPELQYLELWLGRDRYISYKYLAPLFEDLMSGKLFPNLRYLGLRSSGKVKELVDVFDVLSQPGPLAILDLSRGALSDCELENLLVLSKFHQFTVLDIQDVAIWSNREKLSHFLKQITDHPTHILFGITCQELLSRSWHDQSGNSEKHQGDEEEVKHFVEQARKLKILRKYTLDD
jgi:hypothetical protein